MQHIEYAEKAIEKEAFHELLESMGERQCAREEEAARRGDPRPEINTDSIVAVPREDHTLVPPKHRFTTLSKRDTPNRVYTSGQFEMHGFGSVCAAVRTQTGAGLVADMDRPLEDRESLQNNEGSSHRGSST
jgi:hypothetical protein